MEFTPSDSNFAALRIGVYLIAANGLSTDYKVLAEQEKAKRLKAESNENLYRNFLDSSVEGIVGIDLSGRITFANSSAVKLFRFEFPDTMIGKNSHDLVHFKHFDGTPFLAQNCPAVKALQLGQKICLSNELLWRADGTFFYADYSLTPVYANSELTGAVLTYVDTTSIFAVTEQAKLTAYFEEAPTPLALLDGPDHIYKFANAVYRNAFAGTKDLLGSSVAQIFPEAVEQGFVAILDKVFQTGESYFAKEKPIKINQPNGSVKLYYRDLVYQAVKNSFTNIIEGILVASIDATEKVLARRAVEESEEQLNLALDSAGMGTWHIDLDTKNVIASVRAKNLFGLEDIDENVFTVIDQHMHPEDKDEINRVLNEAITSHLPYVHEYRVIRRTGEIRWLLSKGHTIYDDSGNPTTLCGIIVDISDKKVAQLEFEKNLDLAPAMLWLTEVDGSCYYISKQWSEFTGQKNSDGLGNGWLSITHPEDLLLVEKTFREANATHQPFRFEYRVRIKDGNYKWVLDVGNPRLDEKGQYLGYAGTMFDIHDLKIAEQEKQVQAQANERLLEALPFPFFSFDSNWIMRHLNPSGENTLGMKAVEVLGKHVYEIIPNIKNSIFDAAYKRALQEQCRIEVEGICKANGRWYQNWAYPYADGLAVSFLDITDRKLSEFKIENQKIALEKATAEAKKANAAKSSFLANMSHEIRTPLGAIMGFGELLRDQNITREETGQYVDIINRNTKSLTRVIDDILDLSKVEAGKLEIQMQPMNIRVILQEAVMLFSERAKAKGIELLLRINPVVPEQIISDPDRIRQILLNIIGNAVKFTDHGSIKIHVNGFANNTGGFNFQIEVQDTGRGLDKEQAQKLFKPFSQADSATTKLYGGTGLGLVLSRYLAQALGGNVELIQHELGRGCVFKISFCGRLLEKVSAEKKIKNYCAQLPLENVRILLVEDSIDNQILLRRLLERAGSEVSIAENGVAGVTAALNRNFDVVLMDIQMPIMDGYCALKMLTENNYQKPVIALTAHALEDEKKRAFDAGFAAHVTKPVSIELLVKAIHSVLRCFA